MGVVSSIEFFWSNVANPAIALAHACINMYECVFSHMRIIYIYRINSSPHIHKASA
jgi:hypothetical protein